MCILRKGFLFKFWIQHENTKKDSIKLKKEEAEHIPKRWSVGRKKEVVLRLVEFPTLSASKKLKTKKFLMIRMKEGRTWIYHARFLR